MSAYGQFNECIVTSVSHGLYTIKTIRMANSMHVFSLMGALITVDAAVLKPSTSTQPISVLHMWDSYTGSNFDEVRQVDSAICCRGNFYAVGSEQCCQSQGGQTIHIGLVFPRC